MTKQLSKTKSRSWMDLTVEELENIVNTKQMPPNIEWVLPDHPQFARIFRQRNHPDKIAAILLEAKGRSIPSTRGRVKYEAALSPEYRKERLEFKKEELALKKAKMKSNTVMFEKICQLETDGKTLKKLLKANIDLLREIDTRTRKIEAAIPSKSN